ncbi:MAG: hypothetical protein R3A13_01315 [Bdellovibrionota bacterium]
MSDNTYEYTQKDVFQDPNTYMYSTYHGKQFFDDYFLDRKKLIEKLKEKISTSRDFLPIEIKILLNRFDRLPIADELKSFFLSCNFTNNEIKKQPNLSKYLEADECETKSLLEDMLCTATSYSIDASYIKLLEHMRRNIEVKRLVFKSYRKLKKGIGVFEDIENYTYLSFLLCLEFSGGKHLQVLNALLKTNDILSSKNELLTSSKLQAFALLAIAAECGQVKHLMRQEGL